MNYFTIFSKTIPSGLFISLISIAIGYLTFYLTTKRGQYHKEVSDMIMNELISFIIIWKASLFIVHPKLVIQNVMSLVYFTGGKVGFVISLLIIIGILLYQIRKRQVPLSFLNNAITTITFTGFLSYGVLSLIIVRFNSFNLALSLLVLLMIILSKTKVRFNDMEGMLWFSIIMLFLTFILPSTKQLAITSGFTYQQLLFIFIACYSFLFTSRLVRV